MHALNVEQFLKFFAKTLLSIYRSVFAVHVGGGCRFEPSCSQYAIQSYDNFSFFKATKLTLKRLSKCHPFGSFGIDPVPPREDLNNARR